MKRHKRLAKLSICTLVILATLNRPVADGFELEMGLATHHWISKDMYEDNRLIGAGYKRWEFSTFVNSFGDRSYSAGRRWDLFRGLSLSAGMIHGYGDNAYWFPLRIEEEVIFVSLNAEPPVEMPLSFRLRVLGEATLVSAVLRPSTKRSPLKAPSPPLDSRIDKPQSTSKPLGCPGTTWMTAQPAPLCLAGLNRPP